MKLSFIIFFPETKNEFAHMETEMCLFTMFVLNIERKKKQKRNSCIDAFGAAANTDD